MTMTIFKKTLWASHEFNPHIERIYRGNAVNCIEENYVLMQEYTQLNYVPKLQCELSVTQEAHLDAVKICRTNIKVIKRFLDNKLPINSGLKTQLPQGCCCFQNLYS